VRTLFNVLGPLTNPAGVRRQVLGVFAEHLLEPLAAVLANLGAEQVLVVHAADGLDEISIAAPTDIAELKDGAIRRYRIEPADFGLATAPLDAVRVDGPQASLRLVRAALAGEPGPAHDIVLLNAGAAIYAAGVADSLADGVEAARAAIEQRQATERLERLSALTQGLGAATA
jgi:Anthranilate phosphoribosyltransferase